MVKRLIIFLLINFSALAIAGLFTPGGISSDWHQNLIKAPWTPPGWVFGFTWTTIMICLSFYMSLALKEINSKLIRLYSIQLILNIIWTPTFFYFHQPFLSLFFIISLTILIGYLLFTNLRQPSHYVIFLCPYLIWLCIATSLNWYIVLYNS